MLHVGIIGTGAVAQTLGYFLKAHKLYYFSRSGNQKAAFTVFAGNSSHQVSGALYHRNQPLDLCFICTKAFQVQRSLDQHYSTLNCSSYVLLSNGWLGLLVEKLKSHFSESSFLQGSCYLGATKVSGSVTDILSPHPKIYVPSILGFLTNSFVIPTSEFEFYRDRKFLFNLVLNSLTATYRYPYNGMTLQDMNIFEKILSEAYQLLIEITDSQKPAFKSLGEARQSLLDFIQQVYWNQNSMFVDIESYMQTETEFLAGQSVGREGYENLKDLHSYLCL